MAEGRPRRRILGVTTIVLLAIAIATFAFLLRFNALGGLLGGFDNDEFTVLSLVDLVLDGEQPMRDFSEGELHAAWPALTYEVPAAAQRIWGRNLYVHGVLTCGALAICAAAAFLFGWRLSRAWITALVAALAIVLSTPKLYNYPKVLALTVAIALLYWLFAKPTTARVACLAAWTVVSGLFRHDYGIYVGAAAVAGLIAYQWRPWPQMARRLATYAGFGLLFGLPALISVQRYVGIPLYVSEVRRAVDAEGRRLTEWPLMDAAWPPSEATLVAFTYYAFWLFVWAGIAVLLLRGRRSLSDAQRAFGVSLVAMAALANHFFLRANLPARFGDAMAPVAILAVWVAANAASHRGGRVAAHVLASLVLAAVCVSFFQVNEIRHELATGGLSESLHATRTHFATVADSLRNQPPTVWEEKPVERTIAASRYLAECTEPADRVLLATYGDEIPYFARRRIAGGQRRFASNVLRTEANQRLVLTRLARQSVPVVVTDTNYQSEFVVDYPLVAQHIASHYRDVGVISAEGKPILHVWVEKARQPTGTDPVLGFPCFR